MKSPSTPSDFTTYLAYFLDERHPRARGVRVVEPEPNSPRAGRGRFFALVEIMGESPVLEQAVSQIHGVLEQTYYTAGGSLSGVLEQAIRNAHEVLHALNQRNPNTDLRAGVLCAALVQEHLVMASAGPGLALLSTGSRVNQFPADPSHFMGPIGGEQPPKIHFFRHRAREGDVLFLGESDWILLSDVKTLGGAVASATRENRFDVVEYMRQRSGSDQVLGLLAVIHRPHSSFLTPEPPEQAPRGLPTALGATPPVSSVPPVEEKPPEARAVPPVWEATGEPPRHDAATTPAQSAVSTGGTPAQAAPAVQVLPKHTAEPIPRRPVRQASPGWWLRLRESLGRLRRNLLPDRNRGSRPSTIWVGPMQDSGPDAQPARPSLQDVTPPARTRGPRARLFILLALLIPLLAFATVGGVYLRQGAVSRAEAEKLVDMAEVQIVRARQALDMGDEPTARSALGEARRLLDEAIDLLGLTDRIRALQAQLQTEMQPLLRTNFLYGLGVPLTDFPENANPHRVVVFDQDVYVLDIGRQLVEHFRTDPGRALLEGRSGPILRQGDVVEGVTVGRLVDLAWLPRVTGYFDKASLLVLDRNNNLFLYNQVDGLRHLRLAEADALQSVTQVEVYGGRLYLADEQRNQILRYEPAGLGYEQAPDEWFAAQVQVNLAGLVAMAIDGDIWLLQEDGSLLRFNQGNQLPFSREPAPDSPGRLVDMAVSAGGDGRIYLADASQERILVYDKQGAYVEQLQDAEGAALGGLRSIYLDEANDTLFILTLTSLYAHPLPR